MKCEEIKINIPEYIDGKLDKKATEAISLHLKSCDSCTEIYNEFNSFLKFTDKLPEISPPEGMKEEFLDMMESEDQFIQNKTTIIPMWAKVAATILVVFGTFISGYFSGSKQNNEQLLQTEITQLKQEVLLAGLRDYSGPQKIAAVYNIKTSGQSGDNLVDALVYTMNSDKNVNVRLAAINALSEMMDNNETIKTMLINSLSIQENPLLQISLIQVLTEAGVTEAKEKIETISEDENTDQNVKMYAKNMIKTII